MRLRESGGDWDCVTYKEEPFGEEAGAGHECEEGRHCGCCVGVGVVVVAGCFFFVC